MLLSAFGLFLTAFLAATLLPLSSEALLLTLIHNFPDHIWFFILLAGAGNSLGSLVNWALGKWLIHYKDRRWFPMKDKEIKRAESFYRKWGWASLLLAWVPVIGDPLTLVAGILNYPLRKFIPLILISKFGRYIVIALLYLEIIAI